MVKSLLTHRLTRALDVDAPGTTALHWRMIQALPSWLLGYDGVRVDKHTLEKMFA